MKRIILVTGGNRGIGLETCRQLAAAGHTVLLGSRDLSAGEKAAESIGAKAYTLDVTNQQDVMDLSKDIASEHGKLDVLINNAGIFKGNEGALDIDLQIARKVIDTNFYGAWNLIQTMSPLLLKSYDGRIINVSSGMGALKDLVGGYAGYRMSKASLNALTIQLSHEFDGKVKINAVSPGWVRTDMGGANAHRSVEQGAETAVWLATADNIPNGKFLRDKEIIEW